MEEIDVRKSKAIKKRLTNKAKLVREDLTNQLRSLNKFGKFYDDLVDDYVYYLDLKDYLIKDLRTVGIRYLAPTGNGHSALKQNESLQNLPKVTQLMLKILNDLGLQEPTVTDESASDDDLLPANK